MSHTDQPSHLALIEEDRYDVTIIQICALCTRVCLCVCLNYIIVHSRHPVQTNECTQQQYPECLMKLGYNLKTRQII